MQASYMQILTPTETSKYALETFPTYDAIVEDYSLKFMQGNTQRIIECNVRFLTKGVINRVVVQLNGVATVLRVAHDVLLTAKL